MKRQLLLLIIAALAATADAGSRQSMKANFGAICLGPDLSKGPHEKNFFLQVNESNKVRFSGNQEKIAFTRLSLRQTQYVHIFKGEIEIQRLVIDFERIGTNFVVLWKAAKKWRIYPVGGEECVWPPPSCPNGRC
jgi:hypothetical protein